MFCKGAHELKNERNSNSDDTLNTLTKDYQRKLKSYLTELKQQAEASSLITSANVEAIQKLSHRLAGSGQAYNFPELSQSAKELEVYCETISQQSEHTAANAEQKARLSSLISRLTSELKKASLATKDKASEHGGAQHIPVSQRPLTISDMTLLIIDDDNEFSAILSKNLKQYGYETHFLADISQLSDAIEHYRPHAILVDMEFYGERFAGARHVSHWRDSSGYPLPVIFVSAHDGFDVRLAAVKAGGHHFLSKPVDMLRLEGLLQKELGVTEQDVPFRVLLVDDDLDLLALYQEVLERDGYTIFTASNAEEALSILVQSNPELVLIDIFMPDCNGLELGQLIRQHEEFFDTSIVFMSASADTDVKLASSRLSQDEFISKPIEPWRLRMVVKSRATNIRQRYRERLTVGEGGSTTFDRLTALPTLKALTKQLENLLQNSHQPISLLKIDIREFHTINNLYGLLKGDELLQAIAWRLNQFMEGVGAVYRASGDEFYVLHDNGEFECDQVIKRIVKCFSKNYTFGNELSISISADIGVVTPSPSITNASELIGHAETALFAAKSKSSAAIVYFDESMRAWEEKRFNLTQSLESALLNDEFIALYQPILSVDEQEVVGFEVLARWDKPGFGLVPPNEFIPALESNDLITQLTETMLKQGLTQLAQWQQKQANLFMSVNLSAKDIEDPSFLDVVSRLVKHYSINPETIVLEITETTLLSNWQQASDVIRSIQNMKMKLALDDFGTGFSSLSYLNRINADKLKIDRSFIDAWSQTGDARLLNAMVQLGKGMGVEVVAEGIEQEKELLFLRELQCEYYQGFLTAKPMSAIEIESRFFRR